MLEGSFILQQRHLQVTAVKQQAALLGRKHHRAGEQQVVLGSVPGFRVAETGLFQANALTDQPTAQSMPDHQLTFAEKVIRVPQPSIIQAQTHHFTFAGQGQARSVGE